MYSLNFERITMTHFQIGMDSKFESLLVGCNEYHQMEFISTCPGHPADSYACHGNWEEDGISYIISPNPLSRKQTNLSRYCFMLQLSNPLQQMIIEGDMGKGVGLPILKISQVSENCDVFNC